MLMLIGYDLRRPVDYHALGEALDACGEQLSIHSGHRFVDSDESPARVRDCIAERLRPGRRDAADRILVLPTGGSWAHHGLDVPENGRTAAEWLAEHVRGSADEAGVLALAYILHDTVGSDRKAFKKAIEGLSIYEAHGYRHPMNSLSFLATDRAPWAVSSELAKSLPNRGGNDKPDELLVIPVRKGPGAQLGLAADEMAWFREHGIKLVEPKRRPVRPKPPLPAYQEIPPQPPAMAAKA